MRPGQDRACATLQPAPTEGSACERPLEGTVIPALFLCPLRQDPGAVPGWFTSPSLAHRGTRDASILIEDEALSQVTDMSLLALCRERSLSLAIGRVGADLGRCGEPSGVAQVWELSPV